MGKEKKRDEAKHDNRKKGLLLIVSAFVFFMGGSCSMNTAISLF